MLVLFLGCAKEPDISVVDFNKTNTIARPGERRSANPSLRMAIAAMISPKETFVCYRQLLDYIAGRLGCGVEFIQRKTYREIDELFEKGQIDLAFICSGPYATGKDRYGFEALAVPQVRGQHSYRSYLIVNQKSAYRTLDDLRSRVFAFTDPESNTGKLVPTFWLMQKGERVEDFFKQVIYTYSHDNSIMAVAKSLVDGAAIHSQIWEYFNVRNPVHTDKTRIIMESESFGNPPIVASAQLSSQKKTQIREILLSIHEDPIGQHILDRLLIDRFIVPEIRWYDPVGRMQRYLKQEILSNGSEKS
jgi:phosphonate transport system substrate-binding protein